MHDAVALSLGAALALVPAVLLARSRRSALPATPRPIRPELVLFGDSITQQSFQPGGWGARLADAYNRHADIVLRGYSGYNTAWALATLPALREPML